MGTVERENQPRSARQGIVCTGISENISKTRFWKMRDIVQMGKVTDLRLLLCGRNEKRRRVVDTTEMKMTSGKAKGRW